MGGRVPSRGSDQFNLRFPDGMRDRIAQAAQEAGRSMNAEIVARLQATFDGSVAGTSHEIISRIAIAVTMQLMQGIKDGIRDVKPENRDSIEEILSGVEKDLIDTFIKGPMTAHDKY